MNLSDIDDKLYKFAKLEPKHYILGLSKMCPYRYKGKCENEIIESLKEIPMKNGIKILNELNAKQLEEIIDFHFFNCPKRILN